MSPENAKVFLAEDDKTFRRIAREVIEDSSHEVLIEASTLEDALEAISQAERLGVNVAVVDGNLTQDDYRGYDGRRIAEALRRQIPGIKIVSFSGNEQDYGDIHVSKGKTDQVFNLGKIITQL